MQQALNDDALEHSHWALQHIIGRRVNQKKRDWFNCFIYPPPEEQFMIMLLDSHNAFDYYKTE